MYQIITSSFSLNRSTNPSFSSDLVVEAEFLANLCHPNIIKLRGLALPGYDGFANGPCGYFLIIDRLFETLDQRIIRLHGSSASTKRGWLGNVRSRSNSLSSMFEAKLHHGGGTDMQAKQDVLDKCFNVGK